MALTSLSLQRFIACWSRQDLATPISWSALAMNGSALSSSDAEGILQRPQSVPSDNSCLLIEGQMATGSNLAVSTAGSVGGQEIRPPERPAGVLKPPHGGSSIALERASPTYSAVNVFAFVVTDGIHPATEAAVLAVIVNEYFEPFVSPVTKKLYDEVEVLEITVPPAFLTTTL